MNLESKNQIKPKAVIYCRVSTKQQVEEGNSLSTQEKLCREYALKQGYEIVNTFVEKGESAKTTERTELNKLLAYCTTKKTNISFVIVYKLDRFSRNTDDYSYLRIILRKHGIYIKSTTEYFENTPAGKFMENIIANVSQFDNDVRTERAMNGSRDAMREGRYAWTAPYGYSNIRINGKGTIAPNDKAHIIRQIFEQVAKNEYPVEEVRKRLFNSMLVNFNGNPITRSPFYRLLKNEVYTGWIVKFGERHKGLFEPLITQELFDQVQLVLKHRTRKNYSYKTKHPDFPLRRFVSHPNGLKLTGSWSKGKAKKYPYYRFMDKNMNYSKEALERQFRSFMDSFSLKEEHFNALKEGLKMNLSNGLKKRLNGQMKIKNQINQLITKQNLLIERNLEGFISNEILRDQLEQIDKQKITLNSSFYSKPQYNVDFEVLLENAKELLTCPSRIWDKADDDKKLALQVFEFPQGVTYNGSIFRTPELCNLFKVKDIFLDEKSLTAGVKEKVTNTPFRTSFPSIQKEKLIPSAQDNPNTKKYWEEIGKQLIEVNEILKEESVINNNSP